MNVLRKIRKGDRRSTSRFWTRGFPDRELARYPRLMYSIMMRHVLKCIHLAHSMRTAVLTIAVLHESRYVGEFDNPQYPALSPLPTPLQPLSLTFCETDFLFVGHLAPSD